MEHTSKICLPKLLFEFIFVLDKKGGILEQEEGSKVVLGGRSWRVEEI